MTSDTAYVWAWLPGAVEPVVAGRLDAVGDLTTFTYGRSYLERPDRIPLYLPELPLGVDIIDPPAGMRVAGCIADAGPDSWGQRVIVRHLFGHNASAGAMDHVGLLTLLLKSGSDRTGALDFQQSPTEYVPRQADNAPLQELLEAAERLDDGRPLSPALEHALLHASSLGGARPKVHLTGEDGRKLIAKFSRSSDTYPAVNAEGVAMDLAGRCGLDVARAEVVSVGGTDVLLVERFDRIKPTDERRMMVSALTIEALGDEFGRYATYWQLAEEIRKRFTNPKETLRELFSRIAFNICVGNTDDHARNHAAFWNGAAEQLTLTPAYDVCPQVRRVGEVDQAMAYGSDSEQRSRLESLVASARSYGLTPAGGRKIVDCMVDIITAEWDDAADRARLSKEDRGGLLGTSILNPSIFYSE